MTSLPIQRLHHAALTTASPERSKAFYIEVLGFKELERPGFHFRGGWLAGYGMQIHIIENAAGVGERSTEIDSRRNHLAFAVDDASQVTAILEEHGIAYREQVNAGGIHQTFFHDPDGHHIEIAEYPPDPPFVVNDQT